MNRKLSCLKERINGTLRASILVLLFFALVGCSNGNSVNQDSSAQTEIGQLMDENEKLRKELEAALAKEEAENPEKSSTASSEIIPTPTEIVPPQSNQNELVIGEWFYQNFHEEEMNNWIQSLVFNPNGTGKIIRTFYLPADLTAENYSTSDSSGDVTLAFSWNIDGDILHTAYEADGGFVDYTFLSEQQQLLIKNENGNEVSNKHIYERRKPIVPEKYVEKIVVLEDIQAQKAALMRRFLGTWYFDVLTWTFNEDGTGAIDIPKLGNQPATNRSFSYSVNEDTSGMLMTVDWSDSKTTFFWPTINDDGSIILHGSSDTDAIKLNRTFDIDNCPWSEAIIANQMGVFTGSIFSDILPEF